MSSIFIFMGKIIEMKLVTCPAVIIIRTIIYCVFHSLSATLVIGDRDLLKLIFFSWTRYFVSHRLEIYETNYI